MLLIPLLVIGFLYLAAEFWLIYVQKPLLTTRVRAAYRAYPPLGFLVGLGAGLLGAHFFWC